jgi:hypothetical protein
MNNSTHRNKGSNDYSVVNSFGTTDSECDNVEILRSDTEGTSSFMADTSSDSNGIALQNEMVSSELIKKLGEEIFTNNTQYMEVG